MPLIYGIIAFTIVLAFGLFGINKLNKKLKKEIDELENKF